MEELRRIWKATLDARFFRKFLEDFGGWVWERRESISVKMRTTKVQVPKRVVRHVPPHFRFMFQPSNGCAVAGCIDFEWGLADGQNTKKAMASCH